MIGALMGTALIKMLFDDSGFHFSAKPYNCKRLETLPYLGLNKDVTLNRAWFWGS